MGFRAKKTNQKPKLLKRFYKEIILIIIGLIIGSAIGGIGRVSDSKVDKVKTNIDEASKEVESKESELKKLQGKKTYLEKCLEKQD